MGDFVKYATVSGGRPEPKRSAGDRVVTYLLDGTDTTCGAEIVEVVRNETGDWSGFYRVRLDASPDRLVRRWRSELVPSEVM